VTNQTPSSFSFWSKVADVVEKVGLRKRLEPMVRKQTLPSSIDSSPPIDLAQRFIATTENYGARLFQRYRSMLLKKSLLQ
jgi:hypothetical protein